MQHGAPFDRRICVKCLDTRLDLPGRSQGGVWTPCPQGELLPPRPDEGGSERRAQQCFELFGLGRIRRVLQLYSARGLGDDLADVIVGDAQSRQTYDMRLRPEMRDAGGREFG